MSAVPSPRQVFWDHALFADTFLRIQNKRGQLVRLRYNAAQRYFNAHRGRKNIILKARQLGFSTMIQGQIYQDASTTPNTAYLTLSHTDEATQRLRRIFKRFHASMSDDFRPIIGRDSDTLITFPGMDSEVTIATAGGGRAGRGGTITRIHASEAAFWTDPEGILSGAMQAGEPSIDIESTANGVGGYFHQLSMQALDGDKDYTFFFFPWWWDASYRTAIDPDDERDTAPYDEEEQTLVEKYHLTREQINWRRHKKRELGRLFLQEYPEDPRTCFLLSGVGYFGFIDQAWIAPVEDAAWRPGMRCKAGLDFAQVNDYTVLSIVDQVTRRQVDLLRINQMPWGEMRREIRRKCAQWRVEELWGEENSMGSTNLEALREEFEAEGLNTGIYAVTTTNSLKAAYLGNIKGALQDGTLRLLNVPDQRREFEALQAIKTASGWAHRAPDNEHDDTVIANAIVWAGITGDLGGEPEWGESPIDLARRSRL